MQGFLATYFDVLFHPGSNTRIDRQHWWQAAVLVWLVSSILSLSAANGLSGAQISLALAAGWLGSLLMWWVSTLLIHFTADLFGGQGRFADTMTGIGLAIAPMMFIAPLQALPNLFGNLGHTLALLGGMGLLFWTAALLAKHLRIAERFSLDRSLGALILACVFATALVAVSGISILLQIFVWAARL